MPRKPLKLKDDAAESVHPHSPGEAQGHALVPSLPQHPLQINIEPASDYGVPWGSQWPQLIKFYVENPSAFEFTGTNLYKIKGEISALNDTYNLKGISPATLTLRILFAESARPGLRSTQQQRLWLKNQAVGLINNALSDPALQLSASTLLDVLTFHNYERVFGGDIDEIRAHRAGVFQIIDHMGGVENIRGPAEKLVPMILWGDRARQAARVYDPTEPPPQYPLDIYTGLQPLNPINLAFLPWDKLANVRERTLAIGTSILGPGVRIMTALDALKGLSQAVTSVSRSNLAATGVIRHQIFQVEQTLLHVYPQDSEIYTNPKYRLQQLMIEATKISGLIVAHHLSSLLEQTKLTCHRKDHILMRAAMLNVEPLLQDYPRILLWIVFIQASFQDASARGQHLKLASAVVAKMRLQSWEDTKLCLQSVFYYPEVQDVPAAVFWSQIEKSQEDHVDQFSIE